MPYAEQMSPILALSFLLAAGFAGAFVARAARLPSVTGYVIAGVLIAWFYNFFSNKMYKTAEGG